MKTLLSLAVLLVAVLLAGCASTATTQPSPTAVLVTETTTGDDGLNLIAQTVAVAQQQKLIDGPTYWRDFDPGLAAGQAALHTMQDHSLKAAAAEKAQAAAVVAGDTAAANAQAAIVTSETTAGNVARDALIAAVQALQPKADALQAKGAVVKTSATKGK